MFNNKFQITSLVTVVFSALSLVLLAFIFFVIEQRADRTYEDNADEMIWWVLLGLFSVVFMITLGLFLRIDLTRKFIQLMTVMLSIGFVGFIYFRSGVIRDPGNLLVMLPMLGIGICFATFMVGVFALFSSEVVKEEFGDKG